MMALGILFALAGCSVAALALYLAVLALASFFYKQRLDDLTPHARLVVLVPAHDEELLLPRAIESLLAQSYPRQLFRIVVIADNCSDATADVARQAGADEVMIRNAPDQRGKGRALRWAMDQILTGPDPPDALVSIDADTTGDPDLLLGLVERFEHGAEAVQSDYRTYLPGTDRESLRSTAFILMNWVRPAGRNVLGFAAFLVGNGMLLSASVLRRLPWTAFTATEDREYTLNLQYDGVVIALAGAVMVHAPMAPSENAAATQQQRWEGGWAHLLRARFLRLLGDGLRRRSATLLMAALDLAVPPLGLLAGLALLLLALSAIPAGLGAWSLWMAVPAFLAVLSLVVYVFGGLVAAGAPRSVYVTLWRAPFFILTKPLGLRRTLRFRADTWVRTERAGEGTGDS